MYGCVWFMLPKAEGWGYASGGYSGRARARAGGFSPSAGGEFLSWGCEYSVRAVTELAALEAVDAEDDSWEVPL